MPDKKLSARVSADEYLQILNAAQGLGMRLSEFLRFAALNIGKTRDSGEAGAAAIAAVIDRLEELRLDLDLAEMRQAIAGIQAAQREQENAIRSVIVGVNRLFDAIAKAEPRAPEPARSAPPGSPPQPAAMPQQPSARMEAKAPSIRLAHPRTAHRLWINDGASNGLDRQEFYKRHLRQIVEKYGWDPQVAKAEYIAAGFSPAEIPADLYS